ncbi:MAG: co-chaperone GroES [Luteitalea sp.]|nr:co-chaperone GroES [Luteitalea sp.]
MNIQPLHDHIVVQRVEDEEQQIGGIIIPDTAREKPQQARVVAIGPGKLSDEGQRRPLDVKVDDLVLIGKYAGTEIKIRGGEYLILREDEVLGVLEGVAEPVTA